MTWLDGSIPRKVWNMYDHKGVSTNNNAEGYNSKLGAKKQLSKHPNPYTLVEEIKNQLSETSDTVVAETTNNKKRGVNKNYETLREARKGLMKELSKSNIELESYMVQIGAKTLKYQPRVMNDPDPDPLGLGEIRCMREGEENYSNSDDSLDQSLSPQPCTPKPRQPTPPPRACTPKRRQAPSPPQPTKKGPHRRKKQAPVANSEESFIHVEAQPESEELFVALVGGEDLRDIRRHEEEESESNLFATTLSVAAMALAGLTVLSRFSARRSFVGRRTSRFSIGSSPRTPRAEKPPRTPAPSSSTSTLSDPIPNANAHA